MQASVAHVVAPGRRRTLELPRGRRRPKPSAAQNALDLRRVRVRCPPAARAACAPKPDGRCRRRHGRRRRQRARLAAAELEDEPGSVFGRREHQLRIEAALEAGPGIAPIPSLRPVARRAQRIEQRHLQQHVGRRLAVTPVLSPPMMPPRLTARPRRRSRSCLRRARRSGRPEPEPLARPRQAQASMSPVSFAASKTCSGRHRSKMTIVGDVDQGRDRPQADGLEPLLQPARARAVPHAAHDPADEQRAGPVVAGGKSRRIAGPGAPRDGTA